DIRYPGGVPLADGMFPSYTRDIGAVPTVNVAYQDAWRWVVEGARAARLTVEGGMRPAATENVIAELPGADPNAGSIFLGAHHDTQAASVGADDNASGVAGILELARVLAPVPRKRTIRLISFGAEEQLSVGSATYVRARAEEMRAHGRLIVNLDSFGSPMGWTELIVNGPRELEDLARRAFASHRLPVRILREIVPYADHFPFVAAAVPGITCQRSNCASGRFFHHRPDDDRTRVSCALMARILDAVANLVAEIAAAPALPFPREIPEDQRREVERFWVDLFGGWDG
ncbi:MAG: Zn-dependent exopeptidase M28, partial [Planctomycetes bacterium]|nr:Zn-dependent exopeptidase M28 [Planctomycetota bacterium]